MDIVHIFLLSLNDLRTITITLGVILLIIILIYISISSRDNEQ